MMLMQFRSLALALLLGAHVLLASPVAQAQSPGGGCGDVVTLATRAGSTTRYAFVPPPAPPTPTAAQAATPSGGTVTLVLLAGGSGHLDLDDRGCPRALKGNSLVRSIPLFGAAGFGTALVDAPSDWQGEDGLGGFRAAPEHAQDLARVITDLRARTGGAVWVVGTSRGSISAANAAARLSGPAQPDGVVLTSALMVGTPGGRKAWVAQSVFDLPLEAIRQPLLVVGHVADRCLRSPAAQMGRIVARTQGVRQQVVTVAGGPGQPGAPDLNACEGRTPHGFLEQEAEVAAGIARFVRGGQY